MPTSPRLEDKTYEAMQDKLIEMVEELGIQESDVNRKSKLPNGMTVKQLIFAESYLRNGGDSFKASQIAGYKAKAKDGNYGKELLKNPVISQYIMDKMHSKLKVQQLSSDDVLAELINVAMFNIKDAVSWSGNSVTYKSSDEIPDSVASCIKSVNEIKIAGGHKMVRVEFHDKMKALDTITKLMGLHQDTILHKHVTVDSEDTITVEELEADLKRAGLLGSQRQDYEIEIEEMQSPKVPEVLETVQRVEEDPSSLDPQPKEPEKLEAKKPEVLTPEERWAQIPEHLKKRGSFKIS